jgi:hypothetical protein
MTWELGCLTVPADVAITRAERYLDAASGDPWAQAGILQPLAVAAAAAAAAVAVTLDRARAARRHLPAPTA